MGNAKRFFLGFLALVVIFMIYRMSILLLILGLKGASRQLFFVTLSIYLFIPLVKNIRFKGYNIELAEIDKKIRKVYKNFKDDNSTKLQNVTLKYDKKSIKVDSLIITKKGIFNIVYFKEKGHIIVKNYNTWVKRHRNGNEEEIVSPIKAIRRNRDILKRAYSEDEIVDLIVSVNDRCDIEEEDVSSVPIIRYDDIEDYINNYDCDNEQDPEELYEKLYDLKFITEDIDKNLKIYDKYLDYKWQYRSRLAMISFCFVFYILKVIEMSK